MKTVPSGFLAAALLLGASDVMAQGGELDSYLDTVRTRHALAAAVVKDGEIVASGVRALGTDVRVAIDDRFHLGSDTRAMTATLAGLGEYRRAAR
jgi:CubicO group peptidase (beta-lactamase class C family)